MSKVQWGAIIVNGRNKLGNYVYSANAFGSYKKAYVIPTNTISSRRTLWRTVFKNCSKEWPLLSESNRKLWNDLANISYKNDKIGSRIRPSGIDLYIKQNLLPKYYSLTSIPYPLLPDKLFTSVPLSVSFNLTTHIFIPSCTPSHVPTSNVWAFYASAPASAGATSFKRRYKFMEAFIYPNAPYNLYTLYNTAWGLPSVGDQVFIKMVPTVALSWQWGNPIYAVCTVV